MIDRLKEAKKQRTKKNKEKKRKKKERKKGRKKLLYVMEADEDLIRLSK